jgi:hypothetical protein
MDRDNFSLTFVVCGCERFLSFKEEQSLRVFKNRMGPEEEVIGDWRQLHNEELNDVSVN